MIEQVFVFPETIQYEYIDEAYLLLCQEIAKKDFSVEGVDIFINAYFDGKRCFSYLSDIFVRELDVRLVAGRMGRKRQGRACFVEKVYLPGRNLSLFDDFSGPKYELYSGAQWKRDRERFRFLSESERQTICLEYEGSATETGGYRNRGMLCPFLVKKGSFTGFSSALVTEQKKSYRTEEVFVVFSAYLLERVLPFLQPLQSSPRKGMCCLEKNWSGRVTDENALGVCERITELFVGKSIKEQSLCNSWERERSGTIVGESVALNGRCGFGSYISLTDNRGVWLFDVGKDTIVTFLDDTFIVQCLTPDGHIMQKTFTVCESEEQCE